MKNSRLGEAAGLLQLPTVKRLLAEGADPNERCEMGTPLHAACSALATALHIGERGVAAADGILRELAGHGGDLEARGPEGATPLLTAVGSLGKLPRSREESREVFASKPVEVDWRTFLQTLRDQVEPGWPPDDELDWEIQRRLSLLDTLIELGSPLDAQDGNGMSAADLALVELDLPALEYLIRHGASTAGLDAVHLVEAARLGYLGQVAALLARGVDPNVGIGRRGTALDGATAGGHQAVMKMLLAHGAQPKRPDSREEVVVLVPVEGDLPILRQLAAELDGLADTSWRRAQVGSVTLLESDRLHLPFTNWLAIRQISRSFGFSPVASAWSLAAVEPRKEGVLQALRSVSPNAGRRWLQLEIADLQLEAAEERTELAATGEDVGVDSLPGILSGIESVPIPMKRPAGSSDLPLDGRHLVLVSGGMPEAALVLYGFELEELDPATLASVLAWWRDSTGAELGAFESATVEILLPESISEEAAIRRTALELFSCCPDLEAAEEIVAMAASRRWWLWWD